MTNQNVDYNKKLQEIEEDINISQKLISEQLSEIQKCQKQISNKKAFFWIFDLSLLLILALFTIVLVVAPDTKFIQKVFQILD